MNPFKEGQQVRYKDGDTRVYTVYALYGADYVSLALAGYPDTEQDTQTHVNDIEAVL